jgi:hypothetical protein
MSFKFACDGMMLVQFLSVILKKSVMKTNNLLQLVFAGISLIVMLSFIIPAVGSIKGKVTPADAAFQACAVTGKDSFKTNILGGSFEIKNIKPGSYKLIVVATAPFKTIIKEKVTVNDGQATDVGEIVFDK